MTTRAYSKSNKSTISVQQSLSDGPFAELVNLSTFPSAATSTQELHGRLEDCYGFLDDKDGVIRFREAQFLKPAPTQSPRDPLNLSKIRKVTICGSLCFFGAMAAAAELILGAMLPVFVLQYAGIDPKTIVQFANITLPPGTDPLRLLASLPGAPPLDKVYLLGSLPILFIGVSNLIMVPFATAIGRRPVILACGVAAIAGCVWSGNSGSLVSHLVARCIQAIGAGTVESLIPFVISDLTFEHQRNTWMSFVFATQGLIIVGLGFGSPYIIIYMSWRWLVSMLLRAVVSNLTYYSTS